jgi:putative ABC transport system substrate-binding protein
MVAGPLIGVTNGTILNQKSDILFIPDVVLGGGEAVRRREFIVFVGSAAAAWPLAARAQQPDRMRLICVLMGFEESDPAAQSWIAAFRDRLTKLGWTEGSNLRIELRWSAADADRMKTFAKELVDLRPDAIFGQTTPVIGALARETQTIPIVFVLVSDPIGSGFAASLAHPTGNITGFSGNDPTIGGKWMELLKEIAPRTARVALLFNPATAPQRQFYMPSIKATASSVAVDVSDAPLHAKEEIEGVIAAQARTPGGGIIAMPDPFTNTNRELIIALAARYRIPTIFYDPLYAELGGLISYGTDFAELFRQAAEYIDRVLKGAKPGELPIQQPTKYELVINLKTAKALGLTIPESVLSLADKVIE